MNRRFGYRTTALISLLMATANCSGEEPSGLRIGVSPTPPTQGTARIIVTADTLTLDIDTVFVEGRPLDIEDTGARVRLPARKMSPSTFVVDSFPLATAGPWRLVARAVGSRAVVDSLDVRVVSNVGAPTG